ncbi:hypothetical protein Caci_0775 [Catenulispora acidiphila DSM 44928]|uniref:DUF3800 domain-containing protein n=2 Tax=Catenulispora TaxID=414878 RepID=C7Q0T2_CATAD|nr:hypothetical protein Caci_0775 [Catenulispora acidiphila DSM 44928]
MYYVDDSGDPTKGIAVYSWIEVDTAQAPEAMAVWLRFRQQLFETYQIPTDFELHSTNFLAGRGHPSTENKMNQSKTARREIFVAALKLISDLPGVSIGAVHRTSPRRRTGFGEPMTDPFCRLVLGVDRRLFLGDLQGIMVIDGEGDGSCRFYTRLFRSLGLSGQQLIAVPFFQPSYDSQWIQIADIVAYTAYQSVIRRPGREFCWTWYEDYIDPEGPREV